MDYYKDYMNVRSTGVDLASGVMLISTPFYNDAFFNRTVVLILDYSEKGASGLIINKLSHYTVQKVYPSWHVDALLSVGGPVLGEEVFTLHTFADPERFSQVQEGLYAGMDPVLLALIEHHAVGTLKYRFFAGYSGWSEGQLDEEVAQGMWVVSPFVPQLVFDVPAPKVWDAAVWQLGDDYRHWLTFPNSLWMN